MKFAKPVVIMLGVPETQPGPLRRPCMLCERIFPMAESTGKLIDDLRLRKRMFFTLCFEDYADWKREGGLLNFDNVAGVEKARSYLGI